MHDGFLLVDKPAGISSHDAVALVRRARGRIKAGHTGTLDPFATGLLVVALGSATRLIRFVPAGPKMYLATIVFGSETDSDDATGVVTREAALPDEAAVRDTLPRLTGTLDQRPPDYSAKQVGGTRAYAMARRGEDPELPAVPVEVQEWRIESITPSNLVATITCGPGTYIRALARDLGRLTGSAAHLQELRRLRIGPFDVADAVPPDESGTAPLLDPVDGLADLPRESLAEAVVARVRHGRAVDATVSGPVAALIGEHGELVAVAERDGDSWRPRVVLHAR